MSNYKRAYDGSTYFFTVVTYERQPFLCLDVSRTALKESILELREAMWFEIKAWVLLADHLHCVWELPEGDHDFSTRWALIKRGFTKRIKNKFATPPVGISRIKKREATIWQRRFWEHRIRDENDFKMYCDYIHYNPVKHGLTQSPKEWRYSSFQAFVDAGRYPPDWGGGDMCLIKTGNE